MTVRVHCPYCNATTELSSPVSAGGLMCHLCGEGLPTLAAHPDGFSENSSPTALLASALSIPRTRQRRWKLFALAGAGLLVIVGAALIVRARMHHTPPTVQAVLIPPSQTPVTLPALGFLPADCNVIAALRMKAIQTYCAETGQSPKDAIRQAGLPDTFLSTLERSGLPVDRIDHIVAGTYVSDTVAELRFTIVLVLASPLDNEQQFLNAIEAKRDPSGRRDRYRVTIRGLPMMLVRISAQLWVLGWSVKDLEAADRGGIASSAEHFTPDIRDLLETNLSPNAAVWLAIGDGRWSEKPGVKLLAESGLLPKQRLTLIDGIRSGAAGIDLKPQPTLSLTVQSADEAFSQKLRDTLGAKLKPPGTITRKGNGLRLDTPLAGLQVGELFGGAGQ